jgi:signal-transduction protein with cAMP-binding, CBS, and nucleotidyltransferase domain
MNTKQNEPSKLEGPKPYPSNMPLKNLAVSRPQYVMTNTPIIDTINIMKKLKIGSILIVNESSQLIGIATERDLLMKVIGTDMSLNDPIDNIMTKNPKTLSIEHHVGFAIWFMHAGQYRHIPLVDENKKTVGIISIKDILGSLYESIFG